MSKKKEKKKNGSCSSFILAIMLVSLATKIFSCGNTENDDEEYVEQTQEEVQEVELSNHDKFIQDATAIISQTDAENIYDIYTSKIGFENVYFKSDNTENANYTIATETNYTMTTIVGENDYRIFVPETSYVLYENNEVKMTAQDLKDRTFEPYELDTCYSFAKEIVKSVLKDSSSAKFPGKEEISSQKYKNLVAIKGYVTAENSLNAKVKTPYIVEFYVTSYDNYTYEVQYIEIDGNKSGEFIEIE